MGDTYASEEFEAPPLTAREIVQCLQALNFNLSEQDLLKPTGATLRGVYALLVDVVTGVTKEELEQPDQTAIAKLDQPDLHLDCISELAFYRAVHKLVRAAGVRDFSFRNDLLMPRPKRTVRTLSAIINFLKFREERLGKYFELRAQTDDMDERRAQLAAENDLLEQQLAELELEAKQAEPELIALRKECGELEEEVRSLNVHQFEMANASKVLEEEKEALKENKQTLQQTLQNAASKKLKMEARVVQSPEKLKKLLADWTEQVERSIAEIEQKENLCREKKTRIEYLSKIDKEVSHCIRRMENAYSEMEKSRDSRAAAKELEQALEAASQKREDMDEEMKIMHQKIDSTNARLQRLKETLQKQREMSRKQMSQLEAERHSHEREQHEMEQKIRANMTKTRELEQSIAQELAAHNHQRQELHQKYAMLTHEVREYHKTLFTAMGLELEG